MHHNTMERRGNVSAPQSQTRKWYRCWPESECVKGCKIQRKNAASQESYIFLSLLNKILAAAEKFCQDENKGLVLLGSFFPSTHGWHKSRACLKSDVAILSAED